MAENEIGTIILQVAIDIHRKLGPGLLELVYEVVLAHKLKERWLNAVQQVKVPIDFDGIQFDEGFRANLIGEGKVIAELTPKQEISFSDRKQSQARLILTGLKLGYLLNFGVGLL